MKGNRYTEFNIALMWKSLTHLFNPIPYFSKWFGGGTVLCEIVPAATTVPAGTIYLELLVVSC